jgi:hypothetical protein
MVGEKISQRQAKEVRNKKKRRRILKLLYGACCNKTRQSEHLILLIKIQEGRRYTRLK